MQKQIFSLIFSLLLVLTYNTKSYSAELSIDKNTTLNTSAKTDNIYRISDDVLEYQPDPSSPYLKNYKKELMDKKVDTGRALGLSALYFGLGQLYSGETTRGAWILGGGTVLAATVLLLVVPRLADRQEGVTAAGSAISYGVLAAAYLWNVRDAYVTAETINKDIDAKLLYSNNLIKELDKVSVDTKNQTYGLSYKAVSF